MKPFMLMGALLLCALMAHAQLNDRVIAQALISIPAENIDATLDTFDIDYWITENKEGKISLYISYDNSVRAWTLDVGNVNREMFGVTKKVAENIVTKVYIRYRHSNINDLRDFYEYDLPFDTEFTKHEKQLGEDVSHYKIMQY